MSGAPSPTSPGAASGQAAARIDPLDWTKGVLVVLMVVYHCINYSVFRPLAFRLMPFLPPSFVLIAGFVVGAVYTTRYDLRTWSPYARLLMRGGKLFLLFAMVNLGSCILLERSLIDGGFEFVGRSGMIFISGNGREGIFEVLLPIAYLLLLAPVLMWLRSQVTAAILICGVSLFAICLSMEKLGVSSNNLTLLSGGIIGMALGQVPIESMDRFARKWTWTLLFYAAYQISRWVFDDIYPVEMLGAAASVFLLYTCALHLDLSAWAGRQLVMFGRYSLLGYLAQIALIRGIVWGIGGKPQNWIGVVLVGTLTTLLLYFVVNQVNTLRRGNRIVDIIYKTILP